MLLALRLVALFAGSLLTLVAFDATLPNLTVGVIFNVLYSLLSCLIPFNTGMNPQLNGAVPALVSISDRETRQRMCGMAEMTDYMVRFRIEPLTPTGTVEWL